MTNSVKFGTPWMVHDVVGSTNDIARAWALAGAPAGTLVTASSQTRGRGRRGAGWHDTPGQSAIMTFIGPKQDALETVWRLPFVVSLAVMRAVRALGVANAKVKWPNDIVCDNHKLGGILVEVVRVPDIGGVPLIGIGVNVAQSRFINSSEYALPPTSLSLQTKGAVRLPIPVIEAVSGQLTVAAPLTNTKAGWKRAMDEWRGAMVTGDVQRGVSADGESAQGVLFDVRVTDGAALVETADGGKTAIWPSLT